MKIIISPALKMKRDTDCLEWQQLPHFLSDADTILSLFRKLNYEEAKSVWKCNDALATLNYERVQQMDLRKNLTPAVFAYEGIQYQYMAPGVFQTEELAYLEEHLRMVSGFYGLLRPLDGVVPYRLEMQAKWSGPGFGSLYEFWGRRLADQLCSETRCIINLASKEYSKCFSPYIGRDVRFITCVFGVAAGDKVVERSPQVKMARGEMVRYMTENRIKSAEEIKSFDRMNYRLSEELSNESNYVFLQMG